MLHVGDNCVVSRQDIVVILPVQGEGACKSRIILSDGRTVDSPISSATLKKRLEDSFG